MTAQRIAERTHLTPPSLNPDRGGPAPDSLALGDENGEGTLVMECFPAGILAQSDKNGEEDAATLEVLIVHEDLATGLRAKHALDHLADEPGVKLHFVVKLWTFKMLRDPLLRGHAVTDARAAHILFLSLHGHLELPLTVCDLVDHWSADREKQPIALVVSLDEGVRGSAVADATLEYLRTKAVAGGVDLFPHFGAPPSAAWNWASQGVPFQDDARQTALGIPSCTRRFQRATQCAAVRRGRT
jgi:hypothetical protein